MRIQAGYFPPSAALKTELLVTIAPSRKTVTADIFDGILGIFGFFGFFGFFGPAIIVIPLFPSSILTWKRHLTGRREEAVEEIGKALMKIAEQFERYMDLQEFKFFADRGPKGIVADLARSQAAAANYSKDWKEED